MPDFNRPLPIHPADCTCLRCEPRVLAARRRTARDFAVCALILVPAFGFAVLAVLGIN